MSRHGTAEFAKWVVATLVAGDVPAALGGAPAAADIPAGSGWVAVYPIAGGTVEGSVDDPHTDVTPDVQVTVVSTRPSQTLWLVDRVRNLLLDEIPATLASGRRVIFAEPAFADPTLIRDDDVQPPTWYCPDRLAFRTA